MKFTSHYKHIQKQKQKTYMWNNHYWKPTGKLAEGLLYNQGCKKNTQATR